MTSNTVFFIASEMTPFIKTGGLGDVVGALPKSLAETGMDALEEERRLAYVAFTRAKKQLYVSCNNGYSFQTDSHSVPSQFFKEAGLSVPQNTGYFGRNPSWSSQRGQPIRAKRGNYNGESAWLFADDPSKDYFEPQTRPEPKPAPQTQVQNGITDWKVGDGVHHEKFGDGKVTAVIDDTMIVVVFNEVGKKTLLSSHRMLSRTSSKGGVA